MQNLLKLFDLIEAANPEACILVTDKMLDPPGPHIVYANQKWQEVTGYTLKEIQGQSPRILQGPKSNRDMLDQLKNCLKNNQKFIGSTTNYKKDGSTVDMTWVAISDHENYFVAVQLVQPAENIQLAINKLKDIQKQASEKIKEITLIK